GLARVGYMANSLSMMELCMRMAQLSLLLCFFNLLPIPPLDGSQVVRSLTGMSYESYNRIAPFGFVIIILVLQIPIIRSTLAFVTIRSQAIIGSWFGF
ncbi:MAG TPA: site-2 protease family protein, partial [Clostridia bacterium]|nr:site-2 protease family protein [Clostridia bacterium]